MKADEKNPGESTHQLRDIEAVKQVQYAYAYYIDSKNLEGVMSLFADDAIAEYSQLGTESLNLDGIRSFMQGATSPEAGWMAHQMISPYVKVDGRKAYGMFYLTFFGAPTPDTPAGQLTWIQCWYNNEFEKVGSEWKIKHLRLTMQASGVITGSLLDQPWGPFQFPPPFKYS